MFVRQGLPPSHPSTAAPSPWPTLLRAAALLGVLCTQHAHGARPDHARPVTEAATDVAGGSDPESGMPASIAAALERDALEELRGSYTYEYTNPETGSGVHLHAEVEYAEKDAAAWSDGASRSLQAWRRDRLRQRCAVMVIC